MKQVGDTVGAIVGTKDLFSFGGSRESLGAVLFT